MAELHEALEALSPTDWDDVPLDGLDTYMAGLLTSGELSCNSVPPPPEWTALHGVRPEYVRHNDEKSSTKVHSPLLNLSVKDHQDLQNSWGKPLKLKKNPSHISVFKMAAKDGRGAWFARRSIHDGIGFAKFEYAMKREFRESLAVEGGPGSGSIRGIGADARLEHWAVPGIGAVEVYQLSAQFPGPTTPREFIPLVITSDKAMTYSSAVQTTDGGSYVPRSYMTLSKPVTHPKAPKRQGFVRGDYESVELIREIPLWQTKLDGDDEMDRSELNPVEWIMISRSDPGGGIPRFMVDRGTPSAMIGDLHKWLDWARNIEKEFGAQEADRMPADNPSEPPSATLIVERFSSSDSSSAESFVSADEIMRNHNAESVPVQPDSSITSPRVSLRSIDVSKDLKTLTHCDKKALKLTNAYEKLSGKFAKKHKDAEDRLRHNQASGSGSLEKARTRHDRKMEKLEEQQRRDTGKLISHKEREVHRVQGKRRKHDESNAVLRVMRQRDEFKNQVELLRLEVEKLLKQRRDLEEENTAMSLRLRKLGS